MTTTAEKLVALGMPAFKLASGSLTDLTLLRYVATFGKPIILYDVVSAGAIRYMELAKEVIER